MEAVGAKAVRVRSVRAELPAGAVCGGWVQHPVRTGMLIRKMLRSAGIRGGRAVVVVPDDQTAVQILDLPAELPTNMQTFIHTEMRFSPVLVKRRAYADYRSVGADEEGKERILAALTTQECIQNLVETFRPAGVEIQSLQVDFCAVYRAVDSVFDLARKTKHFLLISLTGRTLALSVYQNRKLDFVQRFSWEGPTEGLCSFVLGQVRTVQQFYELEKGVSFHQDWTAAAVLDDDRTFAEELRTGLQAIVGKGLVWITPDERPEGVLPGSRGPVSAASLGAAWRGIDSGADSVPDLLPAEVLERYAWRRSFWKTAVAAALMVGGLYLCTWLVPRGAQAEPVSGRPNQLIQLAEHHKQVKAQVDYLRNLQRASEELNRRRAQYSFSEVLEEVRKCVPAAVQITALEMDLNGGMGISGRARSVQAIYEFAGRLGKSGWIASAAVTESRLDSGTSRLYAYRIVCRLKPSEVEEAADGQAVSD